MKPRTGLLALLLILPIRGWSQGKEPPKEQKKESPSAASGAKTSTNQALDTMEKELKAAAREAKDGGNRALDAVDHTIHKSIQ